MKRIRIIRDFANQLWMVVTLVIVLSLPVLIFYGLAERSYPLLRHYEISTLLFNAEWQPLQGRFGLLGFMISSIAITLVSIILAGPVCLLAAVHLTQFARKSLLTIIHPVIDILAGIPSVVYGVWGVVGIVPFISKHAAPFFGVQTSGYSLLAASLVLAVMIIPFILNVMTEILRTIPAELTEASLSLGATRWETIKKVIIPRARPGLISAVSMGISRAFGETIAVLMVAGNVVHIPRGIFQPGYPLPALMANNYGEMLSIPEYESALMLSGLLLFIIVLIFNMISRIFINHFTREQEKI